MYKIGINGRNDKKVILHVLLYALTFATSVLTNEKNQRFLKPN